MRNILVVYLSSGRKRRKTIDDSIFCFRSQKIDRIFFCNYRNTAFLEKMLYKFNFDVIIYHYTFMTYRMTKEWKDIQRRLKRFKCMNQAAIIQDEYIYSKQTNEFLKEMEIRTVFTLARGEAVKQLYPDIKADFYTVLPGYVDSESIRIIEKLKFQLKDEEDIIDIGYRARKLCYSLGKQGYIKTEIADRFNHILQKYPEVKADIHMTGDTENVFLGLDWYKFLIKCRTMLGCLGGASVLDEDGSLFLRIDQYVKSNPGVTFGEVQEKFIKNDGMFDYSSFSPRFFECAMTKTCQILVEGDYWGGLIPGIHFIEIKKDYSNLDDVIEKIKNKDYCIKIAENAYRDLVESGNYSYKRYVKYVLSHIPNDKCEHKSILWRLNLLLILKTNDAIIYLKELGHEILKCAGIRG